LKKILVTGGLGFIGSHTVTELAQAGYFPVIVDNLCNSDISVLDSLKKITGMDIPFYRCDIRDKKSLKQIFTEHDLYAVIHFAGLKSVADSVLMPLEYYDNNIGGSVILFEIMKECGVKNIIFSSSATVYGYNEEMPLREDMPLHPATNPYGKTKAVIEEILNDMYLSDNGWNIVILRYFNPIGAHSSGLIGEKPAGIPNNLMPYITMVAAGTFPHVNIFGNDYDTPDGTCIRDYIHVCDLAKGHVNALSKIDKLGFDVFNLGTGRGVSVLELVETFSRANSIDIPYEFSKRRKGDLPCVYACTKKAEQVLGFKAEKTVAEMCKDSFNWQKNMK